MAMLAALLLGGCSGTRFGDQLSRSFSAPQPAAKAPPTANSAKPGNTTTTTAKTPSPTTAPAKPATAPTAVTAAAPKPAMVMTPAPYRITIQLPSADPSAPAEVVTEALRKAGVPFEVEMIERVSATGGTAPAPSTRPAPQPR